MDATTSKQAVKDKRQTRINIIINDKHYQVHEESLTGAQLCALADIPAGNQLFLEVPGHGDDEPIGADQQVALRNGMRFYDVPVGNLG